MSENYYLLSISGIALTALFCQWIAWRVRLPAILFLLLAGIISGPVTGLLDPEALFGKDLLPLVSLCVALILFEGSLTLQGSEWREIGSVVRRLVTVGALITWLVIALGTYWLLDFSWSLAVLFGSLTLVTGPTVIMPMLRVVRAKTSIANILRWEGIVIDPLGALLAVVVFSFIVSHDAGDGWSTSLLTFALVLLSGIGFGVVGGWGLGQALRRHLLPEYLHSLAAIAVVFTIFIGANLLMHESGLLAVTIMGIWLANMPGVNVRHILHFKENLSVLLISGLFIILSARLDLNAIIAMGPATLLLLLLIQLVARPLSVWASTLGSDLNWRERALLAWIAPRGIVAAAVSAIFAERMTQAGFAQAELLVPLTFLVIIGTVVLQSATARPLAKLLGVSEKVPNGFLIVGANPFARALAKALQELKLRVLLTDSSWENTRAARMANLPTYFGNATSQDAEAKINLIGMGYLLALSPSNELNSLACIHFRHDFPSAQRFTLPSSNERRRSEKHHTHEDVRGRPLGNQSLTFAQAASRLSAGAEIRNTTLTNGFGWPEYQQMHGQNADLLLAINPQGHVLVASQPLSFEPSTGWTLVALINTPPTPGVTSPPQENSTTQTPAK
jgi:NhaP-type Na+/H+ or K+/H+ antiporter